MWKNNSEGLSRQQLHAGVTDLGPTKTYRCCAFDWRPSLLFLSFPVMTSASTCFTLVRLVKQNTSTCVPPKALVSFLSGFAPLGQTHVVTMP